MKTLLGIILIGIANILGCGKEPEPEPVKKEKKVIVRAYSEIIPYEIWVGWGFDGDPSKGTIHEIIHTHHYYKEMIVDAVPGKKSYVAADASNLADVVSTWDSIFCSVESDSLYMENSIVFTDMVGSMQVPAFVNIPY